MKILTTVIAAIVAFGLTLSAPSATASNKDVDPKLLAKTKKARAVRQRAQLLARRGLFDTALDTYQRALQLYPKYPAVYNEIGVIFIKQREYDRAILAFDEALRMNPEMSAAWANKAEAQRRSKRFADAVKTYGELLKRKPEDAAAHYGLAACYGALNNEKAALWALERYMALEPTGRHSKEVTQQAAALIKRGIAPVAPKMMAAAEPKKKDDGVAPEGPKPEGPDVAVAEPAQQGASEPGEPGQLRAHDGDALFAQKRYVAAIKAYVAQVERQQRSVSTGPAPTKAAPTKAAPTKAARPEVSAKAKDDKKAASEAGADKKAASKAGADKKAAPKKAAVPAKAAKVDVELYYKVGATYAVMGDYRLALRWWRRALVAAPDRELLVRHIGLASRKMAEMGQLKLTSPLAKTGPVAAARAAMVSGQYGTALSLLKGLTDREAYYLRGEAALRLGRLKEARDNFQVIVKQDPKNQAALGGLAEAMVRLNDERGAQKALDAWLGDRMALPEEFLILRRGEADSRIEFGPSSDKAAGDDDDDF